MPKGLSPRGRGKHFHQHPRETFAGSIPAWAGETGIYIDAISAAAVYPRVGGGNTNRPPRVRQMEGLSPRGRGKRMRRRLDHPTERSIPAWAGETFLYQRTDRAGLVYPRVGGGNSVNDIGFRLGLGLSPRGRGKPGNISVR